jgi:hypothetical protein
MSRKILFLATLACALAASGCEERLETGYAPHPLNANESTRRAYYAPAYSPDAVGIKKDDGPVFNLAQ